MILHAKIPRYKYLKICSSSIDIRSHEQPTLANIVIIANSRFQLTILTDPIHFSPIPRSDPDLSLKISGLFEGMVDRGKRSILFELENGPQEANGRLSGHICQDR